MKYRNYAVYAETKQEGQELLDYQRSIFPEFNENCNEGKRWYRINLDRHNNKAGSLYKSYTNTHLYTAYKMEAEITFKEWKEMMKEETKWKVKVNDLEDVREYLLETYGEISRWATETGPYWLYSDTNTDLHKPEYLYLDNIPNDDDYPIITIQEFKEKYSPKQKAQEMNYKVTRAQLKEIHDIACSTWKSKIVELARSFDEFENETSLTQSQVKEMFDAATSSQVPVLERIFPEYKKDKNAFVSKFTNSVLGKLSEELFGGKTVLEIGTLAAKPEDKGKSFYVNAAHTVHTYSTDAGGTIIKILKK